MEGYRQFAYVYDRLTNDIDYQARAAYFDRLNLPRQREKGILLDLACGTGKLSRCLERLGYSVIGVDGEEDMLSVASSYPGEILYLCQDMRQLDLHGTVGTVVCALDGINHLLTEEDVQAVFSNVSLFLEPGGYFLFDVNTLYKHRKVLKDHLYERDYDEIYLIWSNRLFPKDLVRMDLTYFKKTSEGLYKRYTTCLQERAYPIKQLRCWLKKAGLIPIHVYEADTTKAPRKKTQRIVLVAQKMSKSVEK